MVLAVQTCVLLFVSGSWLMREKHTGSHTLGIQARALQSSQQTELQLVDRVVDLSVQFMEGKRLLHAKQDIFQQNVELKTRQRNKLAQYNTVPFHTMSGGKPPHWLPDKYGQVPEKTIWSYYYHPTECPTAAQCKLPDYLQLTTQTISLNRGSFVFILLHHDHIDWYVHRTELPVHFEMLPPGLQSEALMNALLARYGGVALEPSTVLLRPLDAYWDEMVAKGATFRGYAFRINGEPWHRPESTVPWFLMARREGIFSAVVRAQVISMGDRKKIYSECGSALGDLILSPILAIYDYKLPRCRDDPTIMMNLTCCPDYKHPSWWNENVGSSRNDTKLLLRDPRDGPLLPFVGLDAELWNITDSKMPHHSATDDLWQKGPGTPLHWQNCKSPSDCWKVYVLDRFNRNSTSGEAPLLSFIRITGTQIKTMSKSEILSAKGSYFYHLLNIAGYKFSKA